MGHVSGRHPVGPLRGRSGWAAVRQIWLGLGHDALDRVEDLLSSRRVFVVGHEAFVLECLEFLESFGGSLRWRLIRVRLLLTRRNRRGQVRGIDAVLAEQRHPGRGVRIETRVLCDLTGRGDAPDRRADADQQHDHEQRDEPARNPRVRWHSRRIRRRSEGPVEPAPRTRTGRPTCRRSARGGRRPRTGGSAQSGCGGSSAAEHGVTADLGHRLGDDCAASLEVEAVNAQGGEFAEPDAGVGENAQARRDRVEPLLRVDLASDVAPVLASVGVPIARTPPPLWVTRARRASSRWVRQHVSPHREASPPLNQSYIQYGGSSIWRGAQISSLDADH